MSRSAILVVLMLALAAPLALAASSPTDLEQLNDPLAPARGTLDTATAPVYAQEAAQYDTTGIDARLVYSPGAHGVGVRLDGSDHGGRDTTILVPYAHRAHGNVTDHVALAAGNVAFVLVPTGNAANAGSYATAQGPNGVRVFLCFTSDAQLLTGAFASYLRCGADLDQDGTSDTDELFGEHVRNPLQAGPDVLL